MAGVKRSRRSCLQYGWQGLGAMAIAAGWPSVAQALDRSRPTGLIAEPLPLLLRPRALKPGDTIALVAPAGPVTVADLKEGREWLQRQGFQVVLGRHIFNRDGYLAGRDRDRAADLNAAFANPDVAAIICARGGWGCARLLPFLDWDLARSHPKILLGFSDITTLLLAYWVRSGLVTFHGPVIASRWNAFSTQAWQRVLVAGQAALLLNPPDMPHRTIHPGRARGPLVVANLSVLAAAIGSRYLPNWDGVILAIEEVEETVYRVDRLLAQLQLAGVLDRLAGFVFAQCTRCEGATAEQESLSLERAIDDWIRPLKIPSWQGMAIGHIPDKLTLPVGAIVEIDADYGSIRLLEPAVVVAR